MKKILVVIGLMMCAALPAAAMTAQQQKMKDCNAEATQKGLKGDPRKQFMSTCLSAQHDTPPPSAQQMKMKTCNAEAGAKGLKGDPRKQFMSTCLSGK